MKIDRVMNELKEKIEFLENSYEIKVSNLKDTDLFNLLSVYYIRFFHTVDFIEYRRCMLEFFNSLIDDVMCDNRIIIDKEYVVRNLYRMKYIYDDINMQMKLDDIKKDLIAIYGLEQKTLTKK